MMSLVIARRELRGLFMSPLAWSVYAIVFFISALIFVNALNSYIVNQAEIFARSEANYGVTELIIAPLYWFAAFIMLFIIPLLTMRLISEERRAQTLSLLISAPLSMQDIILGKYLGLLSFLLIIIVGITLMPLSLLIGGSLDFGHFFSAFLGLVLLVASFASAGLYMSTLTKYPAVAALGGFGLLFVLWMIQLLSESFGGFGVIEYLSIIDHYKSFIDGVFDTADLIYYMLFISMFLTLSIRRLEAERLPH